MFKVEGTTITLSRGDTGAFDVVATGYTFDSDDRAVFAIRDGTGAVVIQRAYQMTNNKFTVEFANGDTDTLRPGASYTWDVRYVIDPVYDSSDPPVIVDGDQVITPKTPMRLELLAVVGEV